MIRILKMKLKGSKGYDRYLTCDSGLGLGQPILHQISLGRRSASNHGQSRFCEGETFSETLAMPINGGKQIVVVNPPPLITRELAMGY